MPNKYRARMRVSSTQPPSGIIGCQVAASRRDRGGDGTIGARHDCRRPDLLLGGPVNLGDAPTDLSHRNIQTVIKSGVKRRFGISNKLVCAKAQARGGD